MTDIVIYGRGKTGQGLHKLLTRQGKRAVFYDDEHGFDGGECFSDKSLVLLSPGIRPTAKGVLLAKECGAKLISELEYCFGLCAGKLVSVTGTNGKTTTCEMMYHLLRKAGLPTRLLGNGGIPLSSEVLDVKSDEIVVLESSSFQLTDASEFAPYISIFASLGCDHIDYHGSIDNYVSAKINNFANQRDGYAIFNADDVNVVEISKQCKCRKLFYSAYNDNADCYFDGLNVVINFDGRQEKAACRMLNNYVKHNLSNALAAILAAYLLGLPLDKSASYIKDYKLLPHRMEIVATVNGVTFIDDSKATNVHATVNALSHYKREHLALILGGSDKGESFDDIFVNLGNNVMTVAASGDTARKIADCAKAYGIKVELFDDIKLAVLHCYSVLKCCGGIVLMSNACASFDKFGGYNERGEYFHRVVKGLGDGKTTN